MEEFGGFDFDLLQVIGSTEAGRGPYERAIGAACANLPLLFLGAKGTGRACLARAVHQLSGRGKLFELDCSAVPPDSIEAQLFGLVRGLGPEPGEPLGLLLRAHGGSLLLRAVHVLPLAAQQHLEEAMTTGRARCCGAVSGERIDVRLLLTADDALPSLVGGGRILREFYAAASQVAIQLPSPKAFGAELSFIISHLFARAAAEHGRSGLRLDESALASLQAVEWSGNWPALRSALRSLASRVAGPVVSVAQLPAELRAPAVPSHATRALLVASPLADLPYREAKERTLEAFERDYFATILQRVAGNVSEAARHAGLDRSNFRRALRRSRGFRP